jgi:hypothetical protein
MMSEGLTIGWGRELLNGRYRICISYRGRCTWVECRPEDRDLDAAAFYHRFIHPALRTLAQS